MIALPKPEKRAKKPPVPIPRSAKVKKRSRRGLTKKKLDDLQSQIVRARPTGCVIRKKCVDDDGRDLVYQSCHGWPKKAYPATRYVADNLFKGCSRCHEFYTWKPTEWTEWMQANMSAEVYARVRAIALANEKLDLCAIEEDLRLQVAALKGVN